MSFPCGEAMGGSGAFMLLVFVRVHTTKCCAPRAAIAFPELAYEPGKVMGLLPGNEALAGNEAAFAGANHPCVAVEMKNQRNFVPQQEDIAFAAVNANAVLSDFDFKVG